MTVIRDGNEFAAPVLISFTIMVPAVVPSVFHSSFPVATSEARIKRTPLRMNKGRGDELAEPALISLTRTVPAAVPSVFHSSAPKVASAA